MIFNDSNVKSRRVAVVGAGVLSPLGFGLSETAASLRAATDCVTPVTRFPVTNCRCKTAGQIDDDRLLQGRPKTKPGHELHRASHMVIQALAEALAQDPQFGPELVVIGTTSG